MWLDASEDVRVATEALRQAAEAGPVVVRFVGLSKQGPTYRILNHCGDTYFGLDALRRAALLSQTRFTLDK